MLQAISSPSTAARPKFKSLVLDKKSGSTNDKGLKRNKDRGDALTPGKPRTILSTNCYELYLRAATVKEAVQLHLTSYYDILVLKRQRDSSHSQSAFRRHSVLKDSITEDKILPNALLVEDQGKCIYIYQMEKHKTLKQWLSKIRALKEEAMEQLNSCIVNGGVQEGDNWMGNDMKESTSLKSTPETFSGSSYSQGPGSPVQQRAIDSKLLLPEASSKKKSRTLERVVSRSGRKIGNLLRRSTDSQIMLSPEELDRIMAMQEQVKAARSLSRTNRSRVGKKYVSSGNQSYLDVDTDRSGVSNGSRNLVNGEADVFASLGDTIEDVIHEEEGPGGAVFGDVSDDSDVPSGTFSCTSSRCSSIRSYSNREMAVDSSTFDGDRLMSMQDPAVPWTQIPTTESCFVQKGNGSETIASSEDSRRHSGIVRRASEQVMGLLQMRSLREKKRPRRSAVYVRSCYSTSDLDHMSYDTNTTDRLQQPGKHNDHLHQTTPTLPANVPESGGQSRLTTPTANTSAASPTPSQNSESDNGEDFAVSRFHHVQIRRHKWKQSPRIQSPRIQSPLHQGPGIRRTDSHQSETSGAAVEVDGANRGSWNRSVSASPTAQIHVDQWSSRSDTPSEVFDNDSAIHGFNHLTNTAGHTSSTLPRIKKEKKERLSSEAGGSGRGAAILQKSPKISRLFHKRQVSSASLGKVLDLNIGGSEATPFPDQTPFIDKLHLFAPKDVAMELSLVDSELMRQIRPDEIKDGAWTKKATKELLAPNVLAMVRAFNQLALLVPSEILAETTPQARAKVITSYIRIAARCRALHNYNSLKAVLAGLQCTPIYRLTKTWKIVPSRRKKQFDQLCLLMSEDENWRCYREKLQRHLINHTPFIPFLGMFLTQVLQMESFLSIKKSTGPKEKESELSKSCSEESSMHMQSPSMFDHTDIDPVTMETRRRRSASLGEHSFYPRDSSQTDGAELSDDHTPVFTADNSMDHSMDHIGFDCIDGGTDDDPFQAESQGDSHSSSSNEEQAEDHEEYDFNDVVVGENVATYNHLNSPTVNGVSVPSVEIEMYSPQKSPTKDFKYSRNGMKPAKSCETSSEFDVDSEVNEVVLRRNKREALSLEDISIGFRRRSMSLESLLKAYKENRLSLFKMGNRLENLRFDYNYVSYEESDEDEDDDEEEDLERSGKQEDLEEDGLENSMCSVLSETMSDLDLSCSTVNSSFNASLLQKDDEGEGSMNVSSGQVQNDDSQAGFSGVLLSPDAEEIKSSTPMPDTLRVSSAKETKIKQSNSPTSKSGTYKRNRVNLLRKNKSLATSLDEVDISTASPEDILLKLQTATLACGLGVTPRAAVRKVLQESVPNTELENHKLSLQREVYS